MSFPRYPAYKDHEDDWIDQTPTTWSVRSLRHQLLNVFNGVTADQIDPSDATVPVTRIETISSGRIDWERVGHIARTDARADRKLLYGDICFSNINSLNVIGNCAIYEEAEELYGGMNLLVLRPARNVDPKYLYWVIKSTGFRSQVESSAKPAINQASISQSSLLSIPTPYPSLAEQKCISIFLDRETAKIDALVAEQEQLITLLKEKRQAVISHAVTKGLDPSVPMKDSGVEWLGEVPAHWGVRAIKHIVSTPITDGPHETPAFPDDGIPFVSAEAVSTGVIDFDRIRGFISEEDHARYSLKYKPKRGDIFMVKSGATTGVTAMVETDTDFNIWSPLAVIRAASFMSPHFVLQFMRSLNFQEGVTLNWSFGTQQNIGMGVIENLSIVVPPLDEQEAVSSYLKQLLDQFQPLISEATQTIQLLQERRSALISAAVTGQIDVRGLAPAQEQAA